MVDRPPVKLIGLPDGNMNGLEPLHDRAVEQIKAGEIPHGFLLVEYQGDDVIRKLTTGVETVRLRIIAVEELDEREHLGHEGPAERLAQIRSERVGVDPELADGAGEAADRDVLMRRLWDWRDAHHLDDPGLGQAWKDYFGPAAGSFLDASARDLREFLTAKQEGDDTAPAVAVPAFSEQ